MTGSAAWAMDVALSITIVLKGAESEEGKGSRFGVRPRLADDGKRSEVLEEARTKWPLYGCLLLFQKSYTGIGVWGKGDGRI